MGGALLISFKHMELKTIWIEWNGGEFGWRRALGWVGRKALQEGRFEVPL